MKRLTLNIAISFLLILVCLVYRQVLFEEKGFAIFNEEYQTEVLPSSAFVKNALVSGNSTLWNPLILCGMPFMANYDNGYFYPPNIISWILFPPDFSLRVRCAFHLFIASLGLILYLAYITNNPVSSVLAAYLFLISGPTMSMVVTCDLSKLSTLAWWPLILYFSEKFLIGGRKFYLLLISLGIGLSVLAGEMQMFLLMMVFYLLYLIYRHAKIMPRRHKILPRLFYSIFLGTLLGSIAVLPGIELTFLSERFRTYHTSISTSIPFSYLGSFFLPPCFYKGQWNAFVLNFGSIAIILAIWAIIKSRKMVLPFVMFAIFLLLSALGAPVHRLFYHLAPFARYLQGGKELIAPLGIMLAIMSGIGWSILAANKPEGKFFIKALLIILLLESFYLHHSYFGVFTRHNTRPHKKEEDIISGIVKKNHPLSRIVRFGNTKEIFNTNLSMSYGVYDMQGYCPFLLKNYCGVIRGINKDLVGKSGPSEEEGRVKEIKVASDLFFPFLDMLGVRYIISGDYLENNDLILLRDGLVKLYENNKALPRAFLVNHFKVLGDMSQLLEEISQISFNPASTMYLNEEPVWQNNEGPILMPKEEGVRIIDYRPDKIVIEINSKSDTLLFLSDVFYPGWRAYINNRPAKILCANGAFRALAINGGNHIAAFYYLPFSLKLGAFLSACAMIFSVAQTYGRKS